MKKRILNFLAFASFACLSGTISIMAQSVNIIIDKPVNGTFTVNPPLPADGKYPSGSIITVKAIPSEGYVLDAGYYSEKGRWGQMYFESMTPEFKVKADREKHIGASFMKASEVTGINVTQDVVYAKPGVKTLKYDVFSPKGAKALPCIIIIHGGGWSSNTEDIMRGLARELTRDGKFVVFSIDYRWSGKLDGDATNNTMADIVNDVFGAIAHIIENAAKYGGDPSKIGLTGDSAGGHLSALAAIMTNKIGAGGFGKTSGVFEFLPSYLPKNKTLDQVRTEMMASIRAAAPSYGVFGGNLLNVYSDDPAADDTWKAGIAPLSNIPKASDRSVPQYLLRGTSDQLIKDEPVREYVDALVKAGQRVEYVQVGGAGHAFFDWKPDEITKATFAKYGVYFAAQMEAFFVSVLY
jgi:acetyl esterase/lipase